MKKIRSLLATLMVLSTMLFGFIAIPQVAYAGLFDGSKDQACNGINVQDTGGCASTSVGNTDKVNSTLKTVIDLLSLIVGIISVIMIIIGGIKYSTSQGDGSSTSSARNTIIYAIVGLIVVAIAQTIVFFVLNKVTP